jgi:hypothetical protein
LKDKRGKGIVMTQNTTDKLKREALLARLREAKGADPEIDMLVADFFGEKKTKALRVCVSTTHESGVFYPQDFVDVANPYTGSIDAAVALKNRVRPRSRCILIEDIPCRAILKLRPFVSVSGYAATPAIALVCTLLVSMDDG